MQFIINVNDINEKTLADSEDEFTRIDNEYIKVKQFLAKQVQDKLWKEFSSIFTLNPSLKSIFWTQYTPYFNDGDDCVFSVENITALSFIPDEISYDYEDYVQEAIEEGKLTSEDFAITFQTYGNYEELTKKHLSSEGAEALKKFDQYLQNNENYMYKIFGDHVSVLMTSEGFEVSNYEHE